MPCIDSSEIWLSDGWYQIQALLDPPLKEYLKCRRIFQGQKLHIWDAKLAGSRDACTPLEMPPDVRLQIHANGTRRARWHTRLGFHPSPYQTIGVNRAIRGGGSVPCLDLILCRVYPVRYLESLPDGRRRILSEDEEQIARKQRLASFETKVQELHQIKEKERMNSKEESPDSVPLEEKFRRCHEDIMDEALVRRAEDKKFSY